MGRKIVIRSPLEIFLNFIFRIYLLYIIVDVLEILCFCYISICAMKYFCSRSGG